MMLDRCDLVAFAATTDMTRARDFYLTTLGLPLTYEDGYASVFDAHGTTLRVTRVESIAPAPYTVLGWSVPDIEATVRHLADRGVVFDRFDGLPQDDLGVWDAPGGTRVAWFLDPDGNRLSVTQHS